jgi:hypothetical protein
VSVVSDESASDASALLEVSDVSASDVSASDVSASDVSVSDASAWSMLEASDAPPLDASGLSGVWVASW